jgi:hypothetical protein
MRFFQTLSQLRSFSEPRNSSEVPTTVLGSFYFLCSLWFHFMEGCSLLIRSENELKNRKQNNGIGFGSEVSYSKSKTRTANPKVYNSKFSSLISYTVYIQKFFLLLARESSLLPLLLNLLSHQYSSKTSPSKLQSSTRLSILIPSLKFLICLKFSSSMSLKRHRNVFPISHSNLLP